MALAIKSIPILEGEIALEFIKLAENTFEIKRHSIDFSKEKEAAKIILAQLEQPNKK